MNNNWFAELVFKSVLVKNISCPDQIVFYDKETGRIETSISEIAVKEFFGTLSKDLQKEYYETNRIFAKFVYNPRDSRVIYQNEFGINCFNSYIPPEYRKRNHFFGESLPPLPTSPPPLTDKYLRHLVANDSASYAYLLDWLANALTGKNFTILCAIGEAGVGKGKLGEIMSKLVGDSNFAKVRDTVFKKQFNGSLRNKQIVYVDEISITTREEADRIKDVVNDKIEIEMKGVDAMEYENKASFYLSSNRTDAIKIEPSDRRFSIIELTEEPLIRVMSKEEITALTSDSEIAVFGLYLLGKRIESNLLVPFRSKRFDDVRDAGLTEWEFFLHSEFFSKFKDGDFVPLKDVQDTLKQSLPYHIRLPGRHKIKEFTKKFPEFYSYIDGRPRGIQILSTPKA